MQKLFFFIQIVNSMTLAHAFVKEFLVEEGCHRSF